MSVFKQLKQSCQSIAEEGKEVNFNKHIKVPVFSRLGPRKRKDSQGYVIGSQLSQLVAQLERVGRMAKGQNRSE